MEVQLFLNIVIGIAGFLGAWVMNSMSRSILRMEDKIADLPHVYVSRDDYKTDMKDVKEMLYKIFDKLDSKVDKNHVG